MRPTLPTITTTIYHLLDSSASKIINSSCFHRPSLYRHFYFQSPRPALYYPIIHGRSYSSPKAATCHIPSRSTVSSHPPVMLAVPSRSATQPSHCSPATGSFDDLRWDSFVRSVRIPCVTKTTLQDISDGRSAGLVRGRHLRGFRRACGIVLVNTVGFLNARGVGIC